MLIFAKVSTSSFVKVFVSVALSPTLNDAWFFEAHLTHFLIMTYSEWSLESVLIPLLFIVQLANEREVTSMLACLERRLARTKVAEVFNVSDIFHFLLSGKMFIFFCSLCIADSSF